jgi:hypothetical protein
MTATATYPIAVALVAFTLIEFSRDAPPPTDALARAVALALCFAVLLAPWVLP